MTQALDQQTSLVIFRKHASLTLGYSLGSGHRTQTPTERPDIPTLHSHKRGLNGKSHVKPKTSAPMYKRYLVFYD